MKHFIWIFSIVLFSCSGAVDTSQEQSKRMHVISKDSIEISEVDTIQNENSITQTRLANKEQEEFLSFYEKFTEAIIQKNLDAVNECINPDGLYFIETDGAMPHLQKVYDVKAFKTTKRTTFFNLDYSEIEKQPIFDVLPKAICAGEVYDKYGCFVEEVNPLKESGIWNYSGFNEKEIQAIQAAAETINLTVRNTQNFTFYFSKTKQGWKLTFMDIRTPCSA